MCAERRVAVVGGGNSAGQAAMFLAEKASSVCVVVRRPLSATMSNYLVDRIANHPRVQVHEGMTVTALDGDPTLERITVSGSDERRRRRVHLVVLVHRCRAQQRLARWRRRRRARLRAHRPRPGPRRAGRRVVRDGSSTPAVRDQPARLVRRRRPPLGIDQACRRRRRRGVSGDPIGPRAPRPRRRRLTADESGAGGLTTSHASRRPASRSTAVGRDERSSSGQLGSLFRVATVAPCSSECATVGNSRRRRGAWSARTLG